MRYSQRSAAAARPSRSRGARSSMTLAEAIEAYLLHHESINSQPKTLEWHTTCLGLFRDYCDGKGLLTLAQVTTEDAQRWVVDLQKVPTSRGKRSARTVSWYVRSLRAFYRWCGHRGFIAEDITAWLELPKLEKPLIRILETEEFERLQF